MGKYGTNLEGFGAFEGGVNMDKGAPLVSTSSDGETALIFGSAALRTIQAGVENGDFAIPPDAAGDTITESNPLPYWTFTDVNSAGAITCAIVADAGAGSGNVLRFTVASGTLTGKSATLTRYIPVASSASRSFSFYAEATFETGTNSTQANAKLTCQFYKADGVTTTGTAFESDLYGFNSLQAATGITAPDLYAVAPDLTNTTAPADAAFLKLTITIATVATQSADRTVDLTEVRVAHGLPELILTDKGDPATYQPAYIFNESGDLSLVASTGENLVVGMNGYWLGSVSNTIESGGDISLIATGDIIGTAENVDLTATALMTLTADTTNITAPTGVNVSGRLNSTSGITNTGTITSTSNITGGRFYPSNQATRYIEDNGTYLRAINNFWVVGSLFHASSGIQVPIIRVGATAAATTSIPANGSLSVTVTFPALPATPNFAVLSIQWVGTDSNATVVVSGFNSTTSITARLYNQTATAITQSRAIQYVVGAEN